MWGRGGALHQCPLCHFMLTCDIPMTHNDDAGRFAAVARLDLSRLSTFTPAALTYVVGVRGVAALDLTECPQIADEHVNALAAPPQLQPETPAQDESSAGGGAAGGAAAAAAVPTPETNPLQQLILRGCTKVNDGCIGVIAAGCPNLSNIVLDGTSITSAVLEFLGAGCSRLQSVSLKSVKSVGDDGIVGLAKGCGQHLKEIFLDNCGGQFGSIVTNASLDGIVAHCPELKVLSLVGCTNVTDAGVIAVVANCNNLEALDLTKCSAITDASLMALCKSTAGSNDAAALAPVDDAAAPTAPESDGAADADGAQPGDASAEASANATTATEGAAEVSGAGSAAAIAASAAGAGAELQQQQPCCPLLARLNAGSSGVTVHGVTAVLQARPTLKAVGGWGAVLFPAQVASKLSFVGDPRQAAVAVANGEMVEMGINLSGSLRPQILLTAELVHSWAAMIPPNVSLFDLRGNKFVTDEVLDALGVMLQWQNEHGGGCLVKQVNVFGCRVTIDAVERLALRCPTITEIGGWGAVLSPASITNQLTMDGVV